MNERIPTEGPASAREARLRAQLLSGLAGTPADYEQFLREMSAHLRAFLRRRLARNPDDVEDLVQETLLALHNQRHTYDPSQPLTAWAQAIARYKLVDWLRRRGGRQDVALDPDDGYELLLAVDDEAAEARRDLGLLLARLPDGQRRPIQLTKLDGLSVSEASAATGMSESAVKVAVHRGLKALARLIRDEP